jgi:hypothetical protein
MDNVELIARYIASRAMGLVKDPYGHQLPIDLWSRRETQAAFLLKLHSVEEAINIVDYLT